MKNGRLTYPIMAVFFLAMLSCGGGGGESSVPNTSPPRPPQNVACVSGNAQVSLSWDHVNEATTYNIYWSKTAGVNRQTGTKIPNVANGYDHKNLTNGTTYHYVVTVENQYGESGESQEVSGTPSSSNPTVIPSSALSAPTGLSAIAGNLHSLISWTSVSGATAYNLYWSVSADVSGKNGSKVAGVTSPYTHAGLSPNVTYYYVVTAVNATGESPDSAIASVTIPASSLQDICVALGESYTTGYGVSSAENYVSRLQAMLGITVINKGASTSDGPHSDYGVNVIDGILIQYNPKYVTLFFGCNEVGAYDADWTIGNLRAMIQKAKANGSKPVVATQTPVFGQYAWRKPYIVTLNQKIRQLAAQEGIPCADMEVAFGWNSGYILSDGMHPNSAGHQVIANTFYGALTQ